MARARNFLTLDDLELDGKTVLLRVDINSTIDPRGKIIGDDRIRSHVDTIERLRASKLVILAHQSRPGQADCTKLEAHADALGTILGRKVRYIDDLIGSRARDAIAAMAPGQILLLENTRLYAEEIAVEGSAAVQAQTHIVTNLAPLADYFVNDAFAAAHRAQPSLVGFMPILPSAAGLVLEKELRALETAVEAGERPVVVHLGGVKADDSIKIAANMIERGIADTVIPTGLVGHIFLVAEGYSLGDTNYRFMDEKIKNLNHYISTAKVLMNEHRDKISLPVDVAIEADGERAERAIDDLPFEDRILDIGSASIKKFKHVLLGARTIVANGPAGVFEEPEFAIGTNAIYRTIADGDAYSVIGGGETNTVVTSLGIKKNISHVSMGGGALLAFLGGEPLPVYEELKASKRKYEAGNY